MDGEDLVGGELLGKHFGRVGVGDFLQWPQILLDVAFVSGHEQEA